MADLSTTGFTANLLYGVGVLVSPLFLYTRPDAECM